MNTLRAWQMLNSPNESDPLYKRLEIYHYRHSFWTSRGQPMDNIVLPVILGIVSSFLFFVVPILTVSFFGAYWTAYIAGSIRYEHNQHRFDLLALLPGGMTTLNWILLSVHLRNSRIYPLLLDGLQVTRLIGGLVIFVLMSGLVASLLNSDGTINNGVQDIVAALLFTVTVSVFVYMDQIQSVIFSCLLGVTVADHTNSTLEAWLIGVSLFITCQLFMYISLILGFGWLNKFLAVSPYHLGLSLLFMGGLLFGLRELLIRFLSERLQGRVL